VRVQRNPRAHWGLLAAGLLVLVALLLVAGITGGRQGESPDHFSDRGGATPVPDAVLHGGPVLDATRPTAAGARVPDRTIVLTFDDGPSSYTPQILDVLEHYRVPATFFVIGNHVGDHPATLRRMVGDGDEVGVHTFTHPDLGAVSARREQLELNTTQLAIASATGYTTDLLRPPFASTPNALTPPEWRAIARAGSYRAVLTDLDTRDWARPGVSSIVASGTPAGHSGAVVMMHDGGGDRRQTVAALKRLIPALQSRGYRFQTVSHAIGVPSPWSPATGWQRIRGTVVIDSVIAARWLVDLLRALFLAVGALAVLRVLALLALARRHAQRPSAFVPSAQPPGVSMIVPAYNEQAGIEACVRSLLAADYPLFEVIVVDDGSTDNTATVVDTFKVLGVRVIRQVNAGKPAALNAGIAAARHDILVLVDGDTVFEAATLRRLVEPFTDSTVGAVSGNAKVGNRRGLIGRWQHIEYVIGFNLDRRMFDVLRCMPTVPGAIGAFRRTALDAVGGVSDDTLAEDTDLTMALCRAGWRVIYAPQALAWTEAPTNLDQLWKQRYRWCYGTLQSIWKHRRAIIERGASGRLGRRGIPYLLLFQVLLPLLAPVIDVVALFSLFTADARIVGLTWLLFLGVQFVGAGYAFLLDRERLRTLWALPVQQLVYRQLMYLVVIQSLASATYGLRLRWHKLDRTGVLDSAPPPDDIALQPRSANIS
jgi:cellulose synthase/poly-beta-1,6-N-acetylglucosamine synthase-like glycosyltransferase/peptidoglycan/xylan/chitin deacetylase (PgdA/CDA1 family)